MAEQQDWLKQYAQKEYLDRRGKLVLEVTFAEGAVSIAQMELKAKKDALIDLDRAATTFGLDTQPAARKVAKAGPQLKTIAIEMLMNAYPEPLKASRIETEARALLDKDIHPKSTGMTLYRLLLEGKVRRAGHNWFYVPPDEDRREQESPEREGSGPEDSGQ